MLVNIHAGVDRMGLDPNFFSEGALSSIFKFRVLHK